jgi:hypothetical protein
LDNITAERAVFIARVNFQVNDIRLVARLRFKPNKLCNLIVLRDLGHNLYTPFEIAILLYMTINYSTTRLVLKYNDVIRLLISWL